MKKFLLAFVGAVALCAPAQAQVLTYDMSKVTCGDYLAMGPGMASDVSAWMSGWFNQKRGVTTINVQGYRTNVGNVQAWCASNPPALIMQGLQAAAAAAKPGMDGPTSLDTTAITCGDFLKSDPDIQALEASWLGGFFSSTKNITVIDPRYVSRNAKVVGGYCKKNKSVKLFDAVQKNWR